MELKITIDDLSGGEVIALLEEHLRDMHATSPPESIHALDVEALKSPNITFFSAWLDQVLAGCVALKHLSESEVELKSMRTVASHRGKGVASKLLVFVLNYAQEKRYKKISLETGTQDYFEPARLLYKKYGFEEYGPFSRYKLDVNSVFMSREV